MQFFLQKFIFEHKSKFATKKGFNNFFPQVCVFASEMKIKWFAFFHKQKHKFEVKIF